MVRTGANRREPVRSGSRWTREVEVSSPRSQLSDLVDRPRSAVDGPRLELDRGLSGLRGKAEGAKDTGDMRAKGEEDLGFDTGDWRRLGASGGSSGAWIFEVLIMSFTMYGATELVTEVTGLAFGGRIQHSLCIGPQTLLLVSQVSIFSHICGFGGARGKAGGG